MALLQLAARGRDVRSRLPRIVKMLESEDKLERIYGWDALRLVFSTEAERIADYDPRADTQDCRNKLAKLKKVL